MIRKRTIQRLIERYKISITPIPKVRLRVKFRRDGSWTCDFGEISALVLIAAGEYWDENGNYKYKGKHTFWGGQDYVIHQMWRHIQRSAYKDNIHPLDLV